MSGEAGGGVGLWSDGEITIVMAHVTSATWVSRGADFGEDQCSPDCAEAFVINCSGMEERRLNADDYRSKRAFREAGVSFLRALSLYWETRA